jgi:hypothetical protein
VHLKYINGLVLGAPMLFIGSVIPAQAASVPDAGQIVISQITISEGGESSLTVQLDKPASAATASEIKKFQELPFRTSPGAGPTDDEFLVCNKAHIFSDADGTFSIQHACGGITGPWGYKISTGVCAFTISDVYESGMAWTRNGMRQGLQRPHPDEPCRHQFHGNFNPEHDFDIISYSDNFTFEIEVGGQTGHADLNIRGSFYSAK